MFKCLYKRTIGINQILYFRFPNLIHLCLTFHIFIIFLKPFSIENHLRKYQKITIRKYVKKYIYKFRQHYNNKNPNSITNNRQVTVMIKRYTQRRQAKCNFCFEWFFSQSNLKNSIHLCSPCIEKALNTCCYRVPSPDGKEFYQLFLFRNNVKIGLTAAEAVAVENDGEDGDEGDADRMKSSLIQSIDQYRNEEIRKMANKWEDITHEIKNMDQINEEKRDLLTKALKQHASKHPNARQILTKVQCNQAKTPACKLRHANKKEKEMPSDIYFLGSNKKTNKQPEAPTKAKGMNSSGNEKSNYIFNSPSRKPLGEILRSSNNKMEVLDFGKTVSNKKRNFERSKVVESFFMDDQPKLKRNSSQDSLFSRRKQQPLAFQKQKREKDLQQIAQNALKSRIYNYLQSNNTVPPALYLPMTLDIYDALQNTSCLNKCIELVSHNINELDIKCYLNMLDWTGVDILKLVKVKLQDQQFKDVVDFLKDKKVQTLVVTSNQLTEDAVIYFGEIREHLRHFRSLYLGRNRIQKSKVRDLLRGLETQFVLYI